MKMNVAKQLARARHWKQEAAYQAEIIEGLGNDLEYDYERAIAVDAYYRAKNERRIILQTEWDLRRIERYVPHVGLTANVVAEAVNLKQVA